MVPKSEAVHSLLTIREMLEMMKTGWVPQPDTLERLVVYADAALAFVNAQPDKE